MSKFIKIFFVDNYGISDTGYENKEITLYSFLESTDWEEISELDLDILKSSIHLYKHPNSSDIKTMIIEKSGISVTHVLNDIQCKMDKHNRDRSERDQKLALKKSKTKNAKEAKERELFEKLKLKFEKD